MQKVLGSLLQMLLPHLCLLQTVDASCPPFPPWPEPSVSICLNGTAIALIAQSFTQPRSSKFRLHSKWHLLSSKTLQKGSEGGKLWQIMANSELTSYNILPKPTPRILQIISKFSWTIQNAALFFARPLHLPA